MVYNVYVRCGESNYIAGRIPYHNGDMHDRERPELGCVHIDTSTGYGLFIQVSLVRVERSRSLVQADT